MAKKLKILLGNYTLSSLAGSETWTYTLAVELNRLGHDVHAFGTKLGLISEKLEEKGIRCFDALQIGEVRPFSFILEEKLDHDYDVIIANHHNIVEFLRNHFPKTPIISTIHGVIHIMENESGEKVKAPEHPALESGVNQFVAVSEEVQEVLRKEYNIDSVIVRNFLDLKRFSTKSKMSKKPKQFLFNSSYNSKDDEEVEIIREVAKHYDARLTAIGQNFSQTFDVENAIKDADVVVGMGRSVLEGIAMGRLGIVHGRWGTGGVIHEGNIEDLRRFNFSGRNSQKVLMTPEELIKEIDKHYNNKNIKWCKNYVSRDHNGALAAEEYVRLARGLLGDDINSEEVRRIPYKRQRDVEISS